MVVDGVIFTCIIIVSRRRSIKLPKEDLVGENQLFKLTDDGIQLSLHGSMALHLILDLVLLLLRAEI